MSFIIFIIWVVVIWMIIDLRRRVNKLEEKIESRQEKIESEQSKKEEESAPSFQKEEKKSPAEISPSQRATAQATATGPTLIEKLVNWIKKDWILKIGALFILIGFGWLATYAFLHNWIGPMGRIAFGIISGTLILILGWQRIKKYLHQGGVFLVLGSTINLITIFAAREIYGFFTPLSALLVIFLSTIFVALASVKYKNRVLALSSLILATAAPLFINPPPPYDYTALFAYLFIVALGTVWIVAITKQRELTTAALIIIFLYSVPHIISPSTTAANLLPFAYAFAALFFVTHTLGLLKLEREKTKADLITAAGNGFFLLSWIMAVVQKEWQSLIIASWAIIFVAGAFIIFKITQKKKPFYVYSGIAIAMLAAATSAELSGATLTIAYTIEAGIVILLTNFFLRKIRAVTTTGLLMLGPVILSLTSIASESWSRGVIHKDFFVLFTLAITLVGLGVYFWKKWGELKNMKAIQFSSVLLTIGTIYIYALIWLSLHAGLAVSYIATMISLIIYTIVGLITYFYATFKNMNALRAYGSIILVFVVGRLLLIDVWEMELTGRITTFFLVGVLFVSTAFLNPKKDKTKNEIKL